MKPSPTYLGSREIQGIPISSMAIYKKTDLCKWGLPIAFSILLPWTEALKTVGHLKISLRKGNWSYLFLVPPVLSGWSLLWFSNLHTLTIQSGEASSWTRTSCPWVPAWLSPSGESSFLSISVPSLIQVGPSGSNITQAFIPEPGSPQVTACFLKPSIGSCYIGIFCLLDTYNYTNYANHWCLERI